MRIFASAPASEPVRHRRIKQIACKLYCPIKKILPFILLLQLRLVIVKSVGHSDSCVMGIEFYFVSFWIAFRSIHPRRPSLMLPFFSSSSSIDRSNSQKRVEVLAAASINQTFNHDSIAVNESQCHVSGFLHSQCVRCTTSHPTPAACHLLDNDKDICDGINFINMAQYDHVMTQNENEALSQKMKFNLSRKHPGSRNNTLEKPSGVRGLEMWFEGCDGEEKSCHNFLRWREWAEWKRTEIIWIHQLMEMKKCLRLGEA